MYNIIFLLDESISMSLHAASYIKGVNTFLSTQKQYNPNINMTIIKFNNSVTTLCVDSKIHTIPEFTSEHYTPSGTTALYDAIGHAIDLKHANNTIMIILTDGDDNNSKNFNIESINQRINYVQQRGWIFVYIAANQNAQHMGEKLGIGTCLTYNETCKSIANVADACNIVIGHAIYKWSGVSNQYSDQDIPTDLMDEFEKISI